MLAVTPYPTLGSLSSSTSQALVSLNTTAPQSTRRVVGGVNDEGTRTPWEKGGRGLRGGDMRASPSVRKGVRIGRRGREDDLALCFTYCLLPGSRQRREYCSQMVWLPYVSTAGQALAITRGGEMVAGGEKGLWRGKREPRKPMHQRNAR